MNRIISLYTNAYKGLSPSTWWLSVVMLINRMGTMVLPFMTLYMTQKLHHSVGTAGMVMSIWGIGAICGGFLGGRLSDKFGFYYLQITALIGGGMLFIALGQMQNLTAICITTFLLSLVNESFRPANAAAIAHYSKEENRTRSYSLNRLAINLGWAAGGALGGFIASKSYTMLFWIDGLTNIAAAFMLWLRLAPSKNAASVVKPKTQQQPVQSAYKDKLYLVFIVLTIMFSYCFFQCFSTLPIYFRTQLMLTEFQIGLVMAMNGLLIALFEMVIVHNLEGKKHNLQYITIGVALTGLSFIIFNIMPGAFVVAICSELIITVGEILSMPFMNSFWISRSSDANRGQYAGLYTICWSTAQVLGPSTGALVADNWGFDTLWWFIGGVAALSSLGYRWLYSRVQLTRQTA